jgi:uncharacterized UPF0160 family protein
MPENQSHKITIAAHSASFHADDVFAVATILLSLPKGQEANIIRTRHPEEIAAADFVVDVGGIYASEQNRFDHHQKGGAGKRDNGIPYAAFGLVWKHIGPQVCGDDMELWQKIDNELVCAIDANDNGVDIGKNLIDGVYSPTLSLFLMVEKPTWEERGNEALMYERFMAAMEKAKTFLARYIVVQKASIDARREIIATYNATENKSLVVFRKDYERFNFIYTLATLPEIKFFIYPDNAGTWSTETVPVGESSFEKRKPFPEAWAGLHDDALVAASGVEDAFFCHNGRFLCKSRTQEAAIKLAKLALDL